MSSVGCVMAV